jgi:hypothetical protein
VNDAPRPSRRPDSTDPDLAPIDASATTGYLPAYDEPDDVVDVEAVEDPEPVEDGLRDERAPGQEVAARLSRRPRDIVMSLAVLLAVVLGLFGLYRCLGGDEGVTVDPAPVYAEARAAGQFAVAEPAGLGSKWKPISAAYQPQEAGAVLRVGWRTPEGDSVQLIESSLSPDVLLDRELGAGAQPGSEVEINGRRWRSYSARADERAFVLLEPGRTIIVVGQAGDAELRELAAALK